MYLWKEGFIMNNDFIVSLKERADIVDIIGQYIELKRSGSNYKACCPFHKEKTPSFIVNDKKQSYKCFGCGKGGDVYKFIQEIENVEFYDAVSILAKRLGIDIPKDNFYDKTENNNLKKLKEINLIAGRYYYRSLIHSDLPLSYLKKRGITPEMIKLFGLGFANNSSELLDDLKGKFSEDLILESGIATKKDNKLYPTFRERLMFPIFNNRNEIIAFGGRQLGDWGPKYLNSPETKIYSKKINLYALQIARKNIHNDTIFLVEGYMDVISMHQNGYKNTVATLGTALTKEQATILSKLVKNVLILYDSDQAGVNATIKALDILGEAGLDTRVISLDGAKDPDEYLKKYSISHFEKQIDASLDYLLYNIIQIENRYDITSNIGKDSFVKESVDFIKNYLSKPFARQVYVEESVYYISNISGYSIKSIGVDVFGQYFSTKQFARKKESISQKKDFEFEVEEEVDKKELAILNGILIGKLSFTDIEIEDFVHRKNRKLYYDLKMGIKCDLQADYDKVLTSDEYQMLIKSVKNTKLNMRIQHLENLQSKIISSPEENHSDIALIIANYIIKLKNMKK